MGESASPLFAPRAVYDNYGNRWVTMATRQAASPTDTAKYLRLSVSTGSDPAVPTLNYRLNLSGVDFPDGSWVDFPMLGYDQDAILITGNVYQDHDGPSTSYVQSFVVA